MATFDFDQDYYGNQYLRIFKEKKPTLLGIEASVGGLFVAPLYSYFASIVYAASLGNPLGIYLATIIIASLQGPVTFLLLARLKGQKVGIFAGLVTIFSHALFSKAFAPSPINLIYPMGLLFFYFLSRLDQKPQNIIWLGLLSGLSLHIHLSLLALVPTTVLYIIWKKPKSLNPKYLLIAGLIFIFWAMPLILFDIRHDLYLSKNFIDFFLQGINNQNFLANVLRILKALMDVLAGLASGNLIGKFFLVIILLYFAKKLRNDNLLKTAGFVILVTSALFSLYFGNLSDYYFFSLLAPFLLIVASFCSWMFGRPIGKIILLAALGFFLIYNLKEIKSSVNPYNYFVKEKAVRYIKNQAQNKNVKIYFDTEVGLGFGFNYLFKYQDLNLSDTDYEQIYQIVIRGKEESPGAAFREKNVENTIRVIKLL